MRILVAMFLENSERYLFIEPLKDMGHEVLHYQWNFSDAYTEAWFNGGRHRMNVGLCEYAEKAHAEKPLDLIFCYMSARTTELGCIGYLKNQLKTVPIVNFSWDDTLKYNWIAPIAPEFTLCWTTDPASVLKYAKDKARAIYMPGGAYPKLFRSMDRNQLLEEDPSRQTIPDVTFVGLNYGVRTPMLNKLRDAKIDVGAFGQGFGRKISHEEMVQIYNLSLINLGFSRIVDTEFHCVKGRDFEVPMCGGFYLTEDHHQLSHHYRVGTEIETYKSIEECIDKVKYYLEHHSERQRIADAGYARAQTDHTMEERFETLFKDLRTMGELHATKQYPVQVD